MGCGHLRPGLKQFACTLSHTARQKDGPDASSADPADAMNADPREELRALRATTGDMPLAEKLLTPWLRRTMNIYYCGTKSLWSWYTEQVAKVKNTADGLRYYIECSAGGWQKHVAELLRNNLVDDANLKQCELFDDHMEIPGPEQEKRAALMLEFTTRLAANRFFSSAHFDAPPFCYARILSPQPDEVKAGVMRLMKNTGGC